MHKLASLYPRIYKVLMYAFSNIVIRIKGFIISLNFIILPDLQNKISLGTSTPVLFGHL